MIRYASTAPNKNWGENDCDDTGMDTGYHQGKRKIRRGSSFVVMHRTERFEQKLQGLALVPHDARADLQNLEHQSFSSLDQFQSLARTSGLLLLLARTTDRLFQSMFSSLMMSLWSEDGVTFLP